MMADDPCSDTSSWSPAFQCTNHSTFPTPIMAVLIRPQATEQAEDMSDGCGAKFNCIIVSKQFEGKPLLARHRLVNSTLEAELKEIHAFSMKTWTPEQFEKEKAKNS